MSEVTIIDLARVMAMDGAEISNLSQAIETVGYCFIDFRNVHSMADMARQASTIYSASDEYFQQPKEAKMMDTRGGQPSWSDRGYKFCETDESFEMSDDELRAGNLDLPGPLTKQAGVLRDFQTSCREATLVVLSRLAAVSSLPKLMRHHEADRPSESGLKLVAEPSIPRASDVLENKHRDSGTLTLLFYDSWAVQMCLKTGGEAGETWVFVPPPPEGCALVHGAQSLARLSGGRLHSPLHRVTQPTDGAGKRYFLSYFLRPERKLQEEWDALLPASDE